MIKSNINDSDLTVYVYPDPTLRYTAKPIEQIDEGIGVLAEKMIQMMINHDGIGLAATQVGVPLRLFVMSLTGKADDAYVFINPELSDFQGWSEIEEGCLSVPGIRAKVRRHGACTITALDLDGNRFVVNAVDLAAICVQHETDHLDGKLFIDRLSTLSRLSCRKTLKQLEQDYNGQ